MPEIKTTVTIDALKEKVWEILMDLERYPDWNPFMRVMTGTPAVGRTLKFEAHVPGRVLKLGAKVRSCDENRAFSWGGPDVALAGLLVKAEHYVRIEPLGDDRCRVEHGETFGGLLSMLAWPVIRRAEPAYVAMNEALKERAEAGD